MYYNVFNPHDLLGPMRRGDEPGSVVSEIPHCSSAPQPQEDRRLLGLMVTNDYMTSNSFLSRLVHHHFIVSSVF